VVQRACVGKSSCSVSALNTVFGTDPCISVLKALAVQLLAGPANYPVPSPINNPGIVPSQSPTGAHISVTHLLTSYSTSRLCLASVVSRSIMIPISSTFNIINGTNFYALYLTAPTLVPSPQVTSSPTDVTTGIENFLPC